ncbi:MAG: hypothetical protein Q8R02_04175 [Hyphomonadaceae bacterium]|nr:hypothetical protein [Hyphomonadaceae bacterium]
MAAFEAQAEAGPISQTDALAAARVAQPVLNLPNAPLQLDPPVGTRITVTSDDYGQDPVTGDLVSIGPDHVSLRRETPETGVLHVHFPRWGYRIVTA